jgi:hypothetical protein
MKQEGTFHIPSGGEVLPGDIANIRFTVSENYIGDPVKIPVTIINGSKPGPNVFLSAASHGDELNGIEIIRKIAHEWDHDSICGTIVCLPVLNVPAFLAHQRYLPINNQDLNRSFPGNKHGKSANRMANSIFEAFISKCDFGIDFHTSTRGRSNMLHVLADISNEKVSDLANSFGSNVIINSTGPSGSLRRAASNAGIPTIAVELGEAHRFQKDLIDTALSGVESVLSAYLVRPTDSVDWPGWRAIINGDDEKWIRSNTGGIVNMHCSPGELIGEGDLLCTITNPFKTDKEEVRAPSKGLIVGLLYNPVVTPGDPICHLVNLDEETLIEYQATKDATRQ